VDDLPGVDRPHIGLRPVLPEDCARAGTNVRSNQRFGFREIKRRVITGDFGEHADRSGICLDVPRDDETHTVGRQLRHRDLARADPHGHIAEPVIEWERAVDSYGRPRITAELRRRGWEVNAKRVYRLMREDNLLCVRKRKFIVTTDSKHGRKVYPNLAQDMILTMTDQLWRADITYIRLRDEFVFLAVILDAYSRRVIGWALDRTMEEELPLAALGMALARRVVQAGLVHHSDRGTQYASSDYTDLLKANGITISMSRKGNSWDNASCESFMKTLKYEEVLRNKYRDLAEARPPSASSSKRSTTRNGCTRRLATYRLPSSRPTGPRKTERMPLRGSFLNEFSKA
jgi:transposase InsO family protein